MLSSKTNVPVSSLSAVFVCRRSARAPLLLAFAAAVRCGDLHAVGTLGLPSESRFTGKAGKRRRQEDEAACERAHQLQHHSQSASSKQVRPGSLGRNHRRLECGRAHREQCVACNASSPAAISRTGGFGRCFPTGRLSSPCVLALPLAQGARCALSRLCEEVKEGQERFAGCGARGVPRASRQRKTGKQSELWDQPGSITFAAQVAWA